MVIVWVSLLAGLGVMFGFMSLVVDTGYGMSQVRAMQNGADAGALAAAKLLAGTASANANGGVVYLIANGPIHQRAADFAATNRPAALAGATYQIAVEYRPCSGPSPSPNFTAASDPDLVSELGGTTQGSPTDVVPGWTCALRVYARVTHDAMFAVTIGEPTLRETARATARIYPTTPPSLISGVWPISHWLYNDAECPFDPNAPCTFWDSNAPPGGNFKEVVDMSRYSQLALNAGITRLQRFNCGLPVCYDQTYPGNNGKLVDVPNWVRYGWQGWLYVNPDENDPRCTDPARVVQECPNSRLEIYGGDMGANIGQAMRDFINANSEGIDPSCNCRFATLTVFFWRYGVQDTTNSSNSIALNDQGIVWGASNDPNRENPNPLKRVILHKVRRFRFNESTVSSSSVRGYYVSFFSNNPPTGGPPSSVANTIALAD